jgi:hypothetical protein
MFQTMVAETALTGAWASYLQFPGLMGAMLLYWLFLRVFIEFPSYGRVLFAVATVLTNVLIYAVLVSLALRVHKLFRREA